MSGASWLFVPGNRPDRFGKAAAAGAHDVIIDLEDAVVASEKISARDSARAWLSGGGTAWVRVNAISTVWHDADVDALTRCHGLRGVMAPKADEPAPLTALARRLGNPIIALVETAVGVHAAQAIAGCEAVSRIAFGPSTSRSTSMPTTPTNRCCSRAARSCWRPAPPALLRRWTA